MSKVLRLFTFGLLFLLSGYLQAKSETIVTIAHVAPLSGAQSHFGRDNAWGAELAISDLNKKGILLEGKPVTFRLLSLDDKASKREAVAIAKKLCSQQVQGVIGHMNSSTTLAAAPIYYRCGIPMITPSATNPKITRLGFDSVFRVIASDDIQALALADYAASINATRAYVIDDGSNYGRALADRFALGMEGRGLTVAGRASVSAGSGTFQGPIDEAVAANADVIFYGGLDVQAAKLFIEMRRVSSSLKLMGGDGICTLEFASLTSKSADQGVICTNGSKPLSEMPQGEQFQVLFRQQFGEPIQLYAPYVYDATMIMGLAMREASSASPLKYLPYLRRIGFDGVVGNLSFDDKGDVRDAAVTLYTYSGQGVRQMLGVVQ